MKRKLSLVLALCLLCSIFTFVPMRAAEYLYGYVVAKDTGGISGDLMLLISDTEGNRTPYTCQSKVKINSEIYKNGNDASSAIPVGVFIRYSVSGGYINIIDFDETPSILKGMEYNTASNTFSGVSVLPIYYVNGENVLKPNLDENYLYDIEVYDYAVNIINFVSKDSFSVIESINITSNADYTFDQVIGVTCETDEQNAMLCVKLFDVNGIFLAEGKAPTNEEVYFQNIENKDADYKLEVWLEDENGQVISRIYNEEHTVSETPIYKGKVLQKAIEEKIDKEIILQIEDSSGKKTIYTCENRAFINKRRYKTPEEAISEVPMNAEIDFILSDGKISVIGFDDRVKSQFNGCKVENGTFTAKIKTENVLFDFHFMLAIYNGDGALVKIVWESISAQEEGKTISFEADAKYKDYTVKILTWHKTRLSSASDVVSSSVAGE